MAFETEGFFSRVMSVSSLIFKPEPYESFQNTGLEQSSSENFRDVLNSNFTKLADELVSSSGNIDFNELTNDGDFHKAGFNKMNPRVEEALSFLVNQVFK